MGDFSAQPDAEAYRNQGVACDPLADFMAMITVQNDLFAARRGRVGASLGG